ncbi:sn-glycerol-3-phosphate ABC transporter ATP-binding protein UgpC [Dietzia aerolata]|uniref:ABC transporter ATP-binding protein n=1 Tax=Dietzia aerolata TaxID=595984 RepID=A0ABV5JM31_9ACTN|nr:sn-glycerol-3-phosphate ABC transporter ATP-binding protein UgpC [Dietzia aerolata]
MSGVSFENVSIVYPGATRPSVDGLDLHIAEGEFLVLVGPSGCGKSTILRSLAGLEPVTQGRIKIGDQDVTGREPKDRDIAMVFQNYALYPHYTVRENMGFALKLAKKPKAEIAERVDKAAEMLDLMPYLDRKPKELSGGQRQRVAMGRAIVRNPQVFLMDEPLSNLDAKLRVATRAQIAKLQRELHTTMIYVTHDQVEAMTMGDRVAVLRDGCLQQVAAPRELYENPVNAFVAGFIGSPAMNLFDAPVAGGMVALEGLRVTAPSGAQGTVTVGVRPEHLRLAGEGEEGMHAVVDLVEELGADSFLHCSSPDGYPLVYRAESADHPRKGEAIRLVAKERQVRFFDSATGERLR